MLLTAKENIYILEARNKTLQQTIVEHRLPAKSDHNDSDYKAAAALLSFH